MQGIYFSADKHLSHVALLALKVNQGQFTTLFPDCAPFVSSADERNDRKTIEQWLHMANARYKFRVGVE